MRPRRSVLRAVLILAALMSTGPGPIRSVVLSAAKSPGYILQPKEGEVLVGPNGEVVIKVDPATGSARFAMGTQQLLTGSGIAVHMHEHEDEVLFVHGGSAVGILGDERKRIEAGSTIFIPQGVWHGVENPEAEVDLVWVVSPPGLESFFRDMRTPPGVQPRSLTPQQLEDIRRKHGIRSKPQ